MRIIEKMDQTGQVTRLKEIDEHMEIIEKIVEKGGNTLDTQDQLLKLYRELHEEKIQIKKQWMHTERLV